MRGISVSIVIRCLLITFLICVIQKKETSARGEHSEVLDLGSLIREAVEKNPSIIAARNKWLSAQEFVEAQRGLPDPQISYTYFVKNVETRVGPQRHIFSAKQKFPFYGKRDLKAEIATREANAHEAAYNATKQEIVRQVRRTFYSLFYVTKAMEITRSEKVILQRFERIARTKYETGKGNQQNILKVQVEISKVDDRLLGLANQKQTAEAILNTLVDHPADRPLGIPAQPKFRDFFYIKPALFRMAKQNRPELRAGIALIKKSEGAYNLARKNYYPDLTIGANYIEIDDGPLPVSDNGQDAFNVMLSINLPIWRNKLSSQVGSATQTIAARKRSYQGLLNRTLFEVKDTYFKIQTARETFSLYKNVLIPQAEQSLKSAEAGYITGTVSFLDLLDAERILLKIGFGYWKSYTDYLTHIADIERAVGMELAEYPPEDIPPEVEED